MRKILIVVILTVFAIAAWADECADCAKAVKVNGWCAVHKKGFWNGKEYKCKDCWNAVGADAWCEKSKLGFYKGKEFKCKSCWESAKKDGYCAKCKLWYYGAEKFDCEECYNAAKNKGECKKHKRSFKDKNKESAVILFVPGIQDGSSAAEIDNALMKIKGVIKTEINVAEKTVTVVTDGSVKTEDIIKELKDIGYDAEIRK
ncbi:MAG: heavy-metal-associated domain-containing protein [Planctomycetes bacterium]|nr:heavy-metal-associated domain-containing protein [Planctomycetota bacterium]